MRIQNKGGVWKNTEDEILKAAVMKYGKNQWARISSLLVRKTAKQCKARWYEWLDPSIKKTEWSREEEEKLLHLAKIMPNQWKTIAPIVGRTASQCIEHYEKLLDAAQGKEESETSDDPRRLRAGEIDPTPESKPARPDPIDMDEDEKEMLSEARARLANTKGKKAKRKAREKQLEEARRLAALQKRRELKAAGIEVPKPKRKIKGVDYASEIPFQKQPPRGFYEVDFSHEKEDGAFKSPLPLDMIDGKRKRQAEEEKQAKEDNKRFKKKEQTDLPAVIMAVNKANDPDSVRARSKLILPSPQLSDQEMEDFVKNAADTALITEEGSAVTKSLLPNFGTPSSTPLPTRTPLRTPLPTRTPARTDDYLRKEAQNLAALQVTQTPLLGGENPELHASDFTGATPRPMEIKTPNALATPARNLPSVRRDLVTPIRDTLNINEAKAALMEGKLMERQQQQQLRQQLKSGLKSLPAPQNDYQIMLPDLPQEEQDGLEHDLEADASDILREHERKMKALHDMRMRLRSRVVQRDLPRPYSIPEAFADFKSKNTDQHLKQAEELIRTEIINLIQHEAIEYPYQHSKIRKAGHFDEFDEPEILEARKLLEEETKELATSHPFTMDEFLKAYKEVQDDLMYLPNEKKFARSSQVPKKEKIESLTQEFNNLKTTMGREANRAMKLENKLNIYTRGYQDRSGKLLQNIQDLHVQITQTDIELNAFAKLQEIELKAAPSRINTLREQVKSLEQKEAENQQKYLNLLMQRDELLKQKTVAV